MFAKYTARSKWLRSAIAWTLWSGAALAALASPAPADDPPGQALPLRRLTLYSSGVGFFEHRADVDGDAEMQMRFKVENINDLLKSMVLQDLGGGRISTVTYGSKDPITKTLKTFAIDLTNNPTLAQILAQLRGEQVEIEAPNRIVGTIVGVEHRKQRVPKTDEVIEIDVLSLLTEAGLKNVNLDQVGSIKLVNEKLDQELRQALALLATGHDTDKKTVTLHFLGQGKRPVRVGYVQEMPIWKTSYRLVLDEKGSSLLQGWAIVENPTEHDWSDVQLTLVSGRPVSFVMDLYDPLYVQRPRVDLELLAGLRPQRHEQNLAEAAPAEAKVAVRRSRAGGMGVGMAADANMPVPTAAPAAPASEPEAYGFFVSPTSGVQAGAQAGEVGELFQYAIDTPVTLERQKSAMLPIVNGPVEAEKISIYSPAADAKHPLNAVKLKNSTGLHLMQGPITVFDGGAYAGDAQVADVQPGAERIISYALDLDVEVAPESQAEPEQIVSLKLAKGVLESSRKQVRSVEYKVKNSGKSDKRVLIEYPRDPSWKLVAPGEPAESTRNAYRFAVDAKAGETTKLVIREEMILRQQVAVANLGQGDIEVYLSAKTVSDEVKQALRGVIQRRQALEAVARQKSERTGEIAAISEEQGRIRQNMAQLERNTDLYNRFVKKFDAQETRIEKLRGEIEELQKQEDKLRTELENYLLGLDVG